MKTATIVDRLGRVRAQLADLYAEEEQLKQLLIDSGTSTAEGRLFRATVSRGEVTRVDYKGLVEKLDPPKRLRLRYTVVEPRVQVRVVARNAK